MAKITTIDLMKRAINQIKVSAAGKEANFSAQNIINVMHKIAMPEEIPSIPKTRTTIYNNPAYSKIQKEAEAEHLASVSSSIHAISVNHDIGMIELKIAYQEQVYKNELLSRENTALKSVIDQADIKHQLDHASPAIFKSDDNVHSSILARLIDIVCKENRAYVTPSKQGIPATLEYHSKSILGNDSFIKICNFNEVEELFSVQKDSDGRMTLSIKQ